MYMKELAIHSSILSWEILRTEETNGLQSMELQKSWIWLSYWTMTYMHMKVKAQSLNYWTTRDVLGHISNKA